jgi:uncharacterized protein with ParB-like and HNH nuclease domain
METGVRTPNAIFGQPQRFLVPLFQRPYVWNEEQQWEPLWKDLERVASRLLKNPQAKHQPHFLGAVVLQQVQSRTGELPERMVIDGQQRLTTLQILLDALHAELRRIEAVVPAGRIEYLIENDRRFCKNEEDRYKVWPTNRDRPAFNEVMGAPYPVAYESLKHQAAKLVQAHRFFAKQAKDWLALGGPETLQVRADAIERSVRELLQLVVIDLSVDENAQEIFETLNARGAQLTAADLIKNFVFQKLLETGADVEQAYETYWKEFETAFWETEVSAGRLRYQRSSLFINHWLISRTGEEIVAREVFSRFKTFATDPDANVPMEKLLGELSRAARLYRRITEAADNTSSDIDRLGLFAYRIKAMESDVMKSVLLALLDEECPPIPGTVRDSVLDIVESWLTRRMLVRAPTNGYNQVAAEMVSIIRQAAPESIDQAIRSYLMSQRSDTKYWPDDEEISRELAKLPIYQKVSRSRLRMVLEALEDHRRGYYPGGKDYVGMRVARNKYWIEHIMPQSWEMCWPQPTSGTSQERTERINSLGNLTLITAKLNVSVSNGPWNGDGGKHAALRKHDVLLLNRDLDSFSANGWTDDSITGRTSELIKRVIDIWSVPPGYKSSTLRSPAVDLYSVDLADLLSAGYLTVGQTLTAKELEFRDLPAQVLSDGRIDVGGKIFETPSGAAYSLRKRATNGWGFWLVDPATKKSLRSIRREYLEQSSLEAADDGDEDPDSRDDVEN